MSEIKINDVLGLSEEEISKTRIDLDIRLGKEGEKCLDYWLASGDVSFGYHNPASKQYHKVGNYVFAFAQMEDNKEWLLVSAGEVTKIPDKGVNGHCEHQPINDKYEALIGRLIIRIENKPNAMGQYSFPISSYLDKAVVKQILPKRYGGKPFPGFNNVKNINMRELINYLTKTNYGDSWKVALKNVKAVYLLNNYDEGKVYIGSAYNDNGCLLKRWNDYFDTMHGNNKDLKKLYEAHKGDDDYFLDNFYFSILEIFALTTDKDTIIDREHHWMDVFTSRDPRRGYNNN